MGVLQLVCSESFNSKDIVHLEKINNSTNSLFDSETEERYPKNENKRKVMHDVDQSIK